MDKSILYVHGYGSTGNATKGQILKHMFEGVKVVTPTFDYDHLSPFEVQRQLKQLVEENNVAMMVGSSMGGFQTLCATTFFEDAVWVINPVRSVTRVLYRITESLRQQGTPQEKALVEERIREYERFDAEVFQTLPQREGQINMALSTDDETLGDHSELLRLFPLHGKVVWKDNCGHRFLRFDEMKQDLVDCWNSLQD